MRLPEFAQPPQPSLPDGGFTGEVRESGLLGTGQMVSHLGIRTPDPEFLPRVTVGGPDCCGSEYRRSEFPASMTQEEMYNRP